MATQKYVKSQMNAEEERQSITRAVREIIGGRPVTDFPPTLYPKLRTGLSEAKEKALSLSQNDRIKLILQAYIRLNDAEKQYQKKIKQNEELYSGNVKESNKPTDKEINDIIDNLIEGQEIDPIELNKIPFLLRAIKKRIKKHLRSDELEIAQNYEDLYQFLISENKNTKKFTKKERKQQILLQKLEEAEKRLQDAEESYNQQLQEHEQLTQQMIEEEMQKNQIILEQFDIETQGPLPPFNKTFSSELQNLRFTEKNLILCKRYQEAAVLRDKIKEMAEIELENIEDKHLRAREAEREQIIDAHYQRLEYILMKTETRRIDVTTKNDKKIESLQKLVNNLERELNMYDSSHRLGSPLPPSTENISEDLNCPIKINKTKAPRSVRQLSLREPWSHVFDVSKRLTASKIDVIPEPHWKTVEPQQVYSEDRMHLVNSIASPPKTEKIPKRKINLEKNKNARTHSLYRKKNRYEELDQLFGRTNEVNSGDLSTPNRNQHPRSTNSKNGQTTEMRISSLDTRTDFVNSERNSALSRQLIENYRRQNSNNSLRKSTITENQTSRTKGNVYKTKTINRNTMDTQTSSISLSNNDNYRNFLSNLESNSVSINQSNTTMRFTQNTKKSSKSNKNSIMTRNLADSNQRFSNTDTTNKKRISSYTESNNKLSKTSSSATNTTNTTNEDILSNDNIYFNGLTYTQTIDARRNEQMQTKKKIGIANMFGEKSEFEDFCQTVPPSRKDQLPNYS